MFDVGFQEITLIGLIALIVVGPERLPKMARTLGLWMGKIRYYVGQVKSDIDREVRAQELKEMLDKPARELDELKSVAEEAKGTLDQATGVLGEAKTAFDGAPAGISTPGEPAAGSIFPTELPDVGPAPGVPPPAETAETAEIASTSPAEAADTSETASTNPVESAEKTETVSAPPEELVETASTTPAESQETASTHPAEATESEETVSSSPAEAAPLTAAPVHAVGQELDGPQPDGMESGPPDTSSVAADTRESDERSSERV